MAICSIKRSIVIRKTMNCSFLTTKTTQIFIGKETVFVNGIGYVSCPTALKIHDFILFQVRYGKITMNTFGPF